MRIKQIHIKNFKSLVDFKLENLPQFCAFVGPNASGKSNIFEALEFINCFVKFNYSVSDMFGGGGNILSYARKEIELDETIKKANTRFPELSFLVAFDDDIFINPLMAFDKDGKLDALWHFKHYDIDKNDGISRPLDPLLISSLKERTEFVYDWTEEGHSYNNSYEVFIDNFSRIFIGKPDLKRINQPSGKLIVDASNLSQIVGQIFQDEAKREDFIAWLKILIPEFENIEVKKSNIDGSFEFFVFEKSSPSKPFPIKLLSDGTKNILALMAVVYQNSQPQFICIEEPENGLHPQAIELLVEFFRIKCEEEGHHIWLNTHSPTLIRCLEIDEVITVNKVNGQTNAKQFKKEETVNIKMDEAWLTNALGGGVL
jgi:predicted ATPase